MGDWSTRLRIWGSGVRISSGAPSQDDPMSCSFDPRSKIGRRVLATCNEIGGDADHGCWIKGTFKVDANGIRLLTGVFEVRKTEDSGDSQK
jgi:hypothetical protein